jgi:hypothetical protein
VFSFPLQFLSEKFLNVGRTERDRIQNVLGLRVKYPLFLSDCNETWFFFPDRVSKNNQIPNFMKNRPEGAELFHLGGCAGGRTDRQSDRQTYRQTMKLIVALRSFAHASSKENTVEWDNYCGRSS